MALKSAEDYSDYSSRLHILPTRSGSAGTMPQPYNCLVHGSLQALYSNQRWWVSWPRCLRLVRCRGHRNSPFLVQREGMLREFRGSGNTMFRVGTMKNFGALVQGVSRLHSVLNLYSSCSTLRLRRVQFASAWTARSSRCMGSSSVLGSGLGPSKRHPLNPTGAEKLLPTWI